MPAVRQKPVAALTFKRGGRGVVPVLPSPPAVIPEPPEGVGDYAIECWNDFWQTDVAGAVNMRRDGERLRRWCKCVDAVDRLWDRWLDEPVTVNRYEEEHGHPLFSQIMRLEAMIDRLAVKFGMTPLDKMRLTGALDQAERAETSIKARREGRKPVEA